MSVPTDHSRETRDIYRGAGFTGAFELGIRPAVVVVDFCRGFTDPASPLGSDMSEAVVRTRALLDVARGQGVLTVFTTIAFDEGARAAWRNSPPVRSGWRSIRGWAFSTANPS